MRARTFRVPFSRVAPNAVELEWGPDDYLVIRPLLTHSPGEIAAFYGRIDASEKGTEAERRGVLLDLLHLLVVEWSLRDGDGKTIPLPETWEAVNALPAGLAGTLFDFLFTFRGDGPTDPSTAAEPS